MTYSKQLIDFYFYTQIFFVFCRFRTAINVLGDSIGAGIVYHLSKDELDTSEELKEHNGVEVPQGLTISPMSQTNGDTHHTVSPVSQQQNGEKMRILVNPHETAK